MLYINLESESANVVAGRNAAGSEVEAHPIKRAKKYAEKRKVPLFKDSIAEKGNNALKRFAIFREVASVTFSTVIGIRGSFTIKIERIPTNVKINEETTIVPAVQSPVFTRRFVSRKRLKAIIQVENITGITI